MPQTLRHRFGMAFALMLVGNEIMAAYSFRNHRHVYSQSNQSPMGQHGPRSSGVRDMAAVSVESGALHALRSGFVLAVAISIVMWVVIIAAGRWCISALQGPPAVDATTVRGD